MQQLYFFCLIYNISNKQQFPVFQKEDHLI